MTEASVATGTDRDHVAPPDPQLPDHPLAETVYADCLDWVRRLSWQVLMSARAQALREDMPDDVRALLTNREGGHYPRGAVQAGLAYLRMCRLLAQHDRTEAIRTQGADLLAKLQREQAEREQQMADYLREHPPLSPFTASGNGAAVTLPAIEIPTADELRERRERLLVMMERVQPTPKQQGRLKKVDGWEELRLRDPSLKWFAAASPQGRIEQRSVMVTVQCLLEQFEQANAGNPGAASQEEYQQNLEAVRGYRDHPRFSEFPRSLQDQLLRHLRSLTYFQLHELREAAQAAEAELPEAMVGERTRSRTRK